MKPATYLDSNEKFLIGVATKGGSLVRFYFELGKVFFFISTVIITSLIILTQ